MVMFMCHFRKLRGKYHCTIAQWWCILVVLQELVRCRSFLSKKVSQHLAHKILFVCLFVCYVHYYFVRMGRKGATFSELVANSEAFFRNNPGAQVGFLLLLSIFCSTFICYYICSCMYIHHLCRYKQKVTRCMNSPASRPR